MYSRDIWQFIFHTLTFLIGDLKMKISYFSSIQSVICIFDSQLLKSDFNLLSNLQLSDFSNHLSPFRLFLVGNHFKDDHFSFSPCDLSSCVIDSQMLKSKWELCVAKLYQSMKVIRPLLIKNSSKIEAGKNSSVYRFPADLF